MFLRVFLRRTTSHFSHMQQEANESSGDLTSDNATSEEGDSFVESRLEVVDEDKVALTANENPFSQTYTVATAISQVGYGRIQFQMLFLCGVCWAADSMEMMLLGFLLPAVGDEWKLDSFWNATVGAVVFSGMLIGAPLWGVLSDKYGRRLGFIASATLTFVFGLLSSFSVNLPMLLISRGIVGVGIGGAPVAFSLFTEFLPLETRGKNLIMIEAFWSAGAVVEAGLAWLILPRWGWRWLLGISSIPSLILLFLVFKLPESPRYLLRKGKKERAIQVLQRVAEVNKKQLPEGELYIPKSELTSESPFLVFQLFKSKLRKLTILLWIIWFANAFAYYGLVIMTPDYFKTRGGNSENNVYISVFVTSASEFPGLISSALIVDKFGRKRTQALCFFLCCVFTLLLIIRGPFALSTVFAIIARLSIAASFACIYLYTPEAYPTEVRTTALGMASSFSRIGALLCSYVVEFFQQTGDWASLTIFGVSCLIAAITTLLLPLETSKRELK